jgi:uncharacterized protein with PQ loop repeat
MFMFEQSLQCIFIRFLLIGFALSALSAFTWTFKSILTTHVAEKFSSTCLDRCVRTVDLPIPVASLISITVVLSFLQEKFDNLNNVFGVPRSVLLEG